jgi:tetratricopeptide (TPR) repeat protein
VVRKFLVVVCLLSILEAGVGLSAQTAGVAKVPSTASKDDAQGALPGPIAAAEAAILKQDWKTAETALDTYLTTHPTDARALFDAGYVADAQNRLDDAASLYGRSIQADPQRFEAHLSLGLLLARQGKTAEARPELAAATRFHGEEADPLLKARAWRALAEIDKPDPSGHGDAVQASNDLLEALKLSPETPTDTLLAATLAEDTGQNDAAEAAYRRLLAKDPKSTDANAGLAHLYIREKKYPDAETLLRAALAQTPGDPALTAELATDLAAQDKEEALPMLEQLHAAHPQDENITRMLAEVRAQSGDAAGADKMYVALLATRPNNIDLLMAHGENQIRQLHYAEAFAIFDKVTRLDEGNGDAWSGLAFAASKTGRPEVTLHALTMRSKFLPELPSTYFLWATSFDTLHQKTQAIAYYHQFLDAAAGKFPDQEWQARQRLLLLERKN